MARPLLKYALLQIPDVLIVAGILCALRSWWGLDERSAWLLLALWVAKDAALYPWLRRSLQDGGGRIGPAVLVGSEGVVEQDLAGRGWVRVRGELWQAEAPAGDAIPAGTRVRVCAVRGLTLGVERSGDSRTGAGRS
jgi:membrane protein implicated in regulation of membrane protease activity